MLIRTLTSLLFATLIVAGCKCTKEVDCADQPIYPAFIGFAPAEIDTFIIRQYLPNTNYQTLVDTFLTQYSDLYRTSNDTTKLTGLYLKGATGLTAGYDWQLFIPGTQKTVLLTDIKGDKQSIECGALAVRCGCENNLFSATQDNVPIAFSNTDKERPYFYIRK